MRDFRWPPPPDGGPRTFGPGPVGAADGPPDAAATADRAGGDAARRTRWSGSSTGAGDADHRVRARARRRHRRPRARWAARSPVAGCSSSSAGTAAPTRRPGRGRTPTWPATCARSPTCPARPARSASASAPARCAGCSRDSPDRFERLVFFLPAALDEPPPTAALAATGSPRCSTRSSDGDARRWPRRSPCEIPAGAARHAGRLGVPAPAGRPAHARRAGAPALARPAPARRPVARRGGARARSARRALVIGCAGDDAAPGRRGGAAGRRCCPRRACTCTTSPGVLWTDARRPARAHRPFLNG